MKRFLLICFILITARTGCGPKQLNMEQLSFAVDFSQRVKRNCDNRALAHKLWLKPFREVSRLSVS